MRGRVQSYHHRLQGIEFLVYEKRTILCSSGYKRVYTNAYTTCWRSDGAVGNWGSHTAGVKDDIHDSMISRRVSPHFGQDDITHFTTDNLGLKVSDLQGSTQWGGSAGLHPPKPPKPKFKKQGFRWYYDIKSFTRFPLKPKSATEIGWWQVH
jgi:hypothetical protein